MGPSSTALIAAIAQSLELQVLPAVADDRWAASALRSATTLLAHLERRVKLELPMLLADNEDAAATLRAIARHARPDAANPAVFAALSDLLAQPPPVPAFDVDAQARRNREFQSIIERLLRDCHETGLMHDTHTELRAYLERRTARERELYFPVFTAGAPF